MSASVKKHLKQLQSATCAEDIFGDITSGDLKGIYRDWVKKTHPDLCSDKNLAHEALILLNKFLEEAECKFKSGSYGKRETDGRGVTIISSKGNIDIGGIFADGDICDLYRGHFNSEEVMVKVSRDPKHNVFLKTELDTLNGIYKSPVAAHSIVKLILKPFFGIDIKDGGTKRANVFPYNPKFVSLEEIKRVYPDGIDVRDAAWMFNRLLSALIAAHDSGYVHGAIIPSHVLVIPETHEGLLIDWCYSGKKGTKLKAIVPKYKDFYPPEYKDKKELNFGFDIYMASKILNYLTNNKLPTAIKDLMKAAQLSHLHRIQNITEFYRDFQAILIALFGPKKFRKFVWNRS